MYSIEQTAQKTCFKNGFLNGTGSTEYWIHLLHGSGF